MGKIIRHFQCRNKNCKKKPKWANSKYQAVEQECGHCKQVTKAYKSENQGRLFGEFNCKCGSEWFSGNSYEDSWHQCSRCSAKCYPLNLREHDKKESKDESDEDKDEKKKRWKKKHFCQKCKELGYNCQEDVDILMRKNKPLSSLLGDVFLPQPPKISIFEGLDEKPLFPIENIDKEQKKLPKNTTNKQKKKQKKKKDAQANTESIQEKESKKDGDFWDSDNEHDKAKWFYTADDVYDDAPFRLEDYKEKLASGSVKEAPLCNPYRKLYFDHLNTVKQREENKAKKDKAEKGLKGVATSKEGHKVDQNKITNLFICSNIKCAAHGNTAWQNNDSKKEIENCPTCGFKTKAYRTIKSKDSKIESDKPVNSSSSEEKPKPKKFKKKEPWWVLKKRKASNVNNDNNLNGQKTTKNQNSTLEKKMDGLTV